MLARKALCFDFALKMCGVKRLFSRFGYLFRFQRVCVVLVRARVCVTRSNIGMSRSKGAECDEMRLKTTFDVTLYV